MKPQKLTIDAEFKSLIPALTHEEVSGLEASILAEGCREAIMRWNDTVVDGHNRYDICHRHGVLFRTSPLEFKDRNEAKIWIIKNQFSRRNLTITQRAELSLAIEPLIQARAKINQVARKGKQSGATSEKSPELAIDTREEIAKLSGVSSNTISKVKTIKEKASPELLAAAREDRVSINAAAAIAELPKAQQVEVLTRGKGEIQATAKAIKRVKATERVERRSQDKKKAIAEKHPLSGAQFTVVHGDLLTCKLEDNSVDAIITDPPYPLEFIDCYAKLRKLAERILRPGGHLVVMTGQSNILPVMQAMQSDVLKYQWMLGYFTPGQSTQVFGRKVKSNWKPLLWYVKGKNEWEHVEDTVVSAGNDKRFHEWGQNVQGMAQIVERFSTRPALVVDPFCGAGTTGVACLISGRLFYGMDVDASCVAQSAKRLAEVKS